MKRLAAVTVSVAALAAPAAASANATCESYGVGLPCTSHVEASAGSGSLPFTGLDLGALGGGGLILLGSGAILRRLATMDRE